MLKPTLIGVDMDGTIVAHRFPEIGEEIPGAITTLKYLQENGHKVFLWSMRGHPDLTKFPHEDIDTGEFIKQDTLQEALDWLEERGFVPDGVNESPAQFSTSPKQYARVYIDDAALGCPLHAYSGMGYDSLGFVGVDWTKVAYLLWQGELLTKEQFESVCKEVLEWLNKAELSRYD